MKKMYLIGALMLMGVGAALVSCDSIANGCKCTATVAGITSPTVEYSKDEVKAAGVNSCSGLAAKIKQASEAEAKAEGIVLKDYSIKCKAR